MFEKIFTHILAEVEKYGFIEDENIFIDGTHIKANANNHKYRNEVIQQSARYYEEELQKEISRDRELHGKKPLKEKKKKRKVKIVR